jgi:hypothetical protein
MPPLLLHNGTRYQSLRSRETVFSVWSDETLMTSSLVACNVVEGESVK